MIPVSLTGRGPDIKLMKSIALDDPSLKGIWCVPKHSNPTGETYDLDSIEAILDLAESNKEFRIFWDNAYAVHDFKNSLDLPNIFDLAQKYKKEGMTAYSRIQEQEFAREKDGYTSVKHQREVGTSYFDAVSNTISGGKSSTNAMEGSTESEQF